jgi:beta-carotene 3-hydroxylase
MEFVAWFAHKYIMHGLLWNLHEDHHTKESSHSFLEQNDSFFIIFATPAIIFILIATIYHAPYLLTIGLGITAYGTCYFLVHDVFIHSRLKWLRNIDNFYFRAIRRAHKIHHKNIHKEDGECFGMLIVPLKYFKEEKKRKK